MIPAYTVTAVLMVFLAFILNKRFNPHVNSPAFIGVSFIAIIAQLVMDNITAARGFWSFNPTAIIGLYVPVIPVENILFGLALCWFVVLFYELFSNNQSSFR